VRARSRSLAQVDGLERRPHGFGVEFEQRALRDHGADRALDIALGEVVTLGRPGHTGSQHAARGVAAVARSRDGDVIARESTTTPSRRSISARFCP